MNDQAPRGPAPMRSACDSRAWRGLSARGFPLRERQLLWQRRQNQIRHARPRPPPGR